MKNRPVIIVTGASRGLGAAVAHWLGRTKAGVVLVARSVQELQKWGQKVEERGGKSLILPADVSNQESCRLVVEKTVYHFGRLDGVVNNAAIVPPLSSIAEADPKAWKFCAEVNVLGPFYLSKYSIPELRKTRGRIINVSSGAAGIAIESASAYCASKAALNQFTAVLAAEEPDITALAVRPGVMDTSMQAFLRREGPHVMPEATAAYYWDIQTQGLLESPRIPGRSIAWLVLHAPHEMSGMFRSYDDPDIMGPAVDFFREPGRRS
jgi:NAD(P)-dependent dehydrogenase (short-subunit alcohol dehydrogenase family)